MVQCIEAPSAIAPQTLSSLEKSAEKSADSTATHQDSQVQRQLAQLDLDSLNQQFEQATPQEILAWCTHNIPEGLVQTASFSLLAITHMIYKELVHPVPVIFLDTLHLFPETLETARKAKDFYHLDLRTYQAAGVSSREEFAQRYGDKLWERDIDQFYRLTKVEPLQRALDELNVTAWITGRRRDQSETRENLPIIERVEGGRLKINPLANWTNQDIWAYITSQKVLYNPLHDQGYSSIGDEPLTTPTAANEDERAGRWRGSEKTECGIHW
ncbi:MAG: phosphoadenosine phosphosulfate reductase [Phormidesmis priestleyi Ana]|uniref:Phosphoadenosine 5'-phosphosulfate reductase n=1 Tax=Phormidesmis priestleyi Ana TaxID=1666911 RepID=A0A0N8KMS9_9CYAN|nr:MAG: phosphoadenosine phosphosulfate reductase [Phormidesmis priestleyi Ana]